MPAGHEFEVVATFAQLKKLLAREPPILLSVFGSGCPICLQPEAEKQIADAYGEKVALLKASVDEVPELDEVLHIDIIPTIALFRRPSPGQTLGKSAEVERHIFPLNPDPNGENVLEWLASELVEAPPDPSTGSRS